MYRFPKFCHVVQSATRSWLVYTRYDVILPVCGRMMSTIQNIAKDSEIELPVSDKSYCHTCIIYEVFGVLIVMYFSRRKGCLMIYPRKYRVSIIHILCRPALRVLSTLWHNPSRLMNSISGLHSLLW